MLAEMSRLIDTYKLAWLKVDFNFDIESDPARAELSEYYSVWYGLLDELRRRYPHVFFEGCASGGMRSDVITASHFDDHFLSDTVDPHEVLRIYQGALLRMVPGRLGKWAVLRSLGHLLPKYGVPLPKAPEQFVVCQTNGWAAVDPDFAARVAMPGILGLSGDMASFSPQARARFKMHVDFFKSWREFILGSFAHLLTPPAPKNDNTGWAAIQLQHPQRPESLLFVYRLNDASNTRRIRLRGLAPSLSYIVGDQDSVASKPQQLTGSELMSEGIEVKLSGVNSAALLVVSPA
jgi:alpha-galactosidase